jgi:hypothetical protein
VSERCISRRGACTAIRLAGITPRTTTLRLVVAVPAGAGPRALVSWFGGDRVRHSVSRGTVSFRLSTVAGRAASWALSWG